MTAPLHYTVHVDDNYHYMDRDARSTLGEFESVADALKAEQACEPAS